MSQAEIDGMLKEVDSDKNGTIEFNEFCVYMLNQLTKPQDIRRKTFEVIKIKVKHQILYAYKLCN